MTGDEEYTRFQLIGMTPELLAVLEELTPQEREEFTKELVVAHLKHSRAKREARCDEG